MVVDADDVAGHRVVAGDALIGHEGDGVGQLHLAAEAHVVHLHAGLVAPGAHAQEGNAVAVARVHVGLDLEHEAGEGRLGGRHPARTGVRSSAARCVPARLPSGFAGLRRRRPVEQGLQDFLHAEVVDTGAEEHRRLCAGQEAREIKGHAGAANQLDVVTQVLHFIGK